jgi:uroporphyrinogen-III synthase
LKDVGLDAKKVLIPKGNLSGSKIGEFVRSKGGIADEVVVYKTVPNNSIDDHLKAEVSSGRFDTIIFYSPSEVRNFLSVFGSEILKGKEIAVIGPTTRKAAEESGIAVDIVPETSTTEVLIGCLVKHEKTG